jgi:hypothetical protein
MELTASDEAAMCVARRNAWQDALVRYSVLIDGEVVGTLWPWRTGRYPTAPGRHVVRLRGGGRGSSADVVVNVRAGGTEKLRTWSRVRRLPFSWKGILTFLLNPFGDGLPVMFDAFGLWENPRPWIVLGGQPPQPGPVRFDAVFTELYGSQNTADGTEPVMGIVSQIDGVTFGLQKGGYAVSDVDDRLQRLRMKAQGGQPISSEDFTTAVFRSARRGYDRRTVDAFLLTLAHSTDPI